jgi:hypothetical protein
LKVKSRSSGNSHKPILPTYYNLFWVLSKVFDYNLIKELSIYEAWLYYAQEFESIKFSQYLMNIPTEKSGKVIEYKETFYIE